MRAFGLIICVYSVGFSVHAASLAQRIDQLIEAKQPGRIAGEASDAAFLRRIHLDLLGMIPTGEEARKFLESEDPKKREKLVAELMKRPEFVRHLVRTFDLMLMERRPDKYVKADPWREYLFAALSANQPYHQLVGDLLGADGSEKERHAAAKFLLEREAEPSSLTRDIGRILLGKDMQCAQCHDHPRIDDYVQRDYYGIYAFVNRLSVFQPDRKKPAIIAEKAEGAAEFKSVFTKVEGTGLPQLPGDEAIADPKLDKGKEWKVAPDKKKKNLRPIPAYSRQAELAKSFRTGANRDFRRNIVNRLWAHMLGSGIVEPLDFHHSGNPPTHPELLDLLADEFAAMNFDVRKFLQTVALTRTYQRSFAMPDELVKSPGDLMSRISKLEAECERLGDAAEATWKRADELRTKLQQAFVATVPLDKELAAAKKGVPALQKSYDAARKNSDRAKKTWEDRVNRYAKYFKQADEARAKDPKKDDPKRKLTSAERRAATYQKQIDGFKKTYDGKHKLELAALKKLNDAKAKVAAVEKKIAAAKSQVPKLKRQIRDADEARKAAAGKSKLASRELAQLKALNAYNELRSQMAEGKSASLEARHDGALRELTEIWSRNFAVAGLVPLTPEQLAHSLMQATGERGRLRLSGERDFENKSKQKNKKKQPVPNDREQYVEKYVYEAAEKRVARFVSLFSAGVGSRPTEFFASADQALFFENAGDVRGWLGPSSSNLVDRLRKQTDPRLFAEDLYLSVFTRFPNDAEYEAVAEFLKGREKDLTNAAGEIAWALLTSTEFRFKH